MKTLLNSAHRLHPTLLILCLISFSPLSSAGEQQSVVGSISFVRGSCAALQPGQAARILGKGSEIYRNDNIQTSERSFTIITFTDGAKITVRPNSSLSINEYSNRQKNKQAQLTLHKGGVRTSSGEIARNNPDRYQIQTPYATVNAQQADYSVRICQQDCLLEAEKHKDKIIKKNQTVVGRIVTLQGDVTAEQKEPKPTDKNQSKSKRQLTAGAPLYTDDHVNSRKNSYALMAFRDGGRMTLQAESEFDIKKYSYQQESEQDRAIYNLVKGGLRALTGHIGKVEKANYQVNTPVATIGIRGTGFDLHCEGDDCEDNTEDTRKAKKKLERIKKAQAEGLYSRVWKGGISQTNKSGRYELDKPKSNYIANQQSKPIALSHWPARLQGKAGPRPDKVPVNENNLFGSSTLSGTPIGVYVTVHDGYIKLTNRLTENIITIDLGKDESGYVSPEGKIIRLDRKRRFQVYDVYPLPSEFDEKTAEIGAFSILAKNYDDLNAPIYQCLCD